MAEANAKFVISAENQTGAAFAAIKRSFGDITASAGKLSGALAAVGATAALGTLALQFKEIVSAAAQLDDFSEKTGAAVGNLSQLQQVAKISGQDFGAVTDILVKLSRALAGQGTDDESKGVGAALKRIGLSADELRQKDPADALRAIAVELNKYEDSGGKAAIITSLLGKSAATLLPYLKDLATEQGIVARVTSDQAAAAENLEKSLARLSLESANAKQAFLLGLVPVLNDVVEKFNVATRAAGSFLGGLSALLSFKTLEDPAVALAKTNDELERARKIGSSIKGGLLSPFNDAEVKRLELQQKIFEDVLRQRIRAANVPLPVPKGSLADYKVPERPKAASAAGVSPFDSAVKQLEAEAVKVDDLSRRFEVLRQIQLGHFGDLNPQQKQRLEDLAAEVDRTREITKVAKDTADARQKLVEFADRERAAQEKIADAWRDAADPLRAYNRHLEEGASLLRKGLINVQTFNAASNDRLSRLTTPQDTDFDVLNKALKEGDISLEKYNESLVRLRGELVKTGDDGSEIFSKINSGLEDAIVNGAKFSDVLKSVAQDIAKVLIRQQITEPLGKAASGLFSGAGGGGGFVGGVADIFKGLFSGAAGAANGADFTVGGVGGTDSQLLAMRVTPGEHVSIRTPAQQQTAGSGVTVNFNPVIDARGADIGAVQRIEAALRNLQANVVPMVVDAVRRNGPARQFLRG